MAGFPAPRRRTATSVRAPATAAVRPAPDTALSSADASAGVTRRTSGEPTYGSKRFGRFVRTREPRWGWSTGREAPRADGSWEDRPMLVTARSAGFGHPQTDRPQRQGKHLAPCRVAVDGKTEKIGWWSPTHRLPREGGGDGVGHVARARRRHHRVRAVAVINHLECGRDVARRRGEVSHREHTHIEGLPPRAQAAP
eukprot:1183185-Prorocentrum_minimum.AAC.1